MNPVLSVRLAREQDIPALLDIFRSARAFMIKTGNPTQWPQTFPNEADIRSSLSRNDLYVIENGCALCGTFVLRFGPDPMYQVIQEGSWPNDEPYMTVHRLASNGTVPGIADTVFRFAEAHPSRFLAGQIPEPDEPVRYLRIDTHRNNGPMQKCIRENGFAYCGIVHTVTDHTERLAFQKAL